MTASPRKQTIPERPIPVRPSPKRDEQVDRYINLKLAALGQPVSRSAAGADFLELAGPLLRNYYQKDQLLGDWLCASDSPHSGLPGRLPQRRLPRRRRAPARQHLRPRPRRHGARLVPAR